MALKPPQAPHPPRRGDRERERETQYADWEGIRPLRAEDLARNFDREDGWNQRFHALRAARDRTTQNYIQSGRMWLLHSIAIETGVLEGLYEPSHNITETLVRKGFSEENLHLENLEDLDVEPQHLLNVLGDHLDAITMISTDIHKKRPITKHAIRELHAQITAHQETHAAVDMLGKPVQRRLRRGVWKDFPNNPMRPDGTVHLYAPPEQVDPQMELLLELYGQYRDTHHPLLTGAWLHHRFIQIHPFVDGNGRTARSLLFWHLERAGWLPALIHRIDRDAYLYGMDRADAGDLSVLVDFFIAMTRKSIRLVMTDFSPEERMKVLGPDEPGFEHHKEDDRRNGV